MEIILVLGERKRASLLNENLNILRKREQKRRVMRLKHCCDCGLHTSVGCWGYVGLNSGSWRDGTDAIGIPRRMGNLHLLITNKFYRGEQ